MPDNEVQKLESLNAMLTKIGTVEKVEKIEKIEGIGGVEPTTQEAKDLQEQKEFQKSVTKSLFAQKEVMFNNLDVFHKMASADKQSSLFLQELVKSEREGGLDKLIEKVDAGEEIEAKERKLLSRIPFLIDAFRASNEKVAVNLKELTEGTLQKLTDRAVLEEDKQAYFKNLVDVVSTQGAGQDETLDSIKTMNLQDLKTQKDQVEALNAILTELRDKTEEVKLHTTLSNLDHSVEELNVTQGEVKSAIVTADLGFSKPAASGLVSGLGMSKIDRVTGGRISGAISSAIGSMMTAIGLGKGGKLAGLAAKGMRFAKAGALPAAVAYMGYRGIKGAYSGTKIGETERIFGKDIGKGEFATTGQTISAGIGGALSSLSFGLLDKDKITLGLHKNLTMTGALFKEAGMKIGGFFTKTIPDNLSKAWGFIKSLPGKFIEWGKGAGKGLLKAIMAPGKFVYDYVKEKIKGIFEGFDKGFIEGVKNIIKKIWESSGLGILYKGGMKAILYLKDLLFGRDVTGSAGRIPSATGRGGAEGDPEKARAAAFRLAELNKKRFDEEQAMIKKLHGDLNEKETITRQQEIEKRAMTTTVVNQPSARPPQITKGNTPPPLHKSSKIDDTEIAIIGSGMLE